MKITFYRISVLLRQQKRIGIRNFSTSGAFCRNAQLPTVRAIQLSLGVSNQLCKDIIIIIIIIKKGRQCKAERAYQSIHPISPKTSALPYQPIDRQKRKGKRAKDYSWDRSA